MSRRRRAVMVLPVGCVILAAALAGCTAGPATAESPSSAPASASSGSSSSSSSSSDALYYPDGASADTPECQDASSAVVAAVNATISNPLPGGSNSVTGLSVTPDPDHAVWLMTGVIASTPGAEGYLVSWATTADPTHEVFEGNLRSVGGTTANLSSAPVIQFPDGEVAGGLPPAALACASGMPRNSSR